MIDNTSDNSRDNLRDNQSDDLFALSEPSSEAESDADKKANDTAFSAATNTYHPLADRMRPTRLSQYIGQSHLLQSGKPLHDAIIKGHLHSMIFWGPPGTGKTTLARLVASAVDAPFMTLSAVLSGVKDIREAIEQARQQQKWDNRSSVLFVDEVHRFNKAQQDAFLPHIESGLIYFIGATTENPSFELNNALLSRARVYVLQALKPDELEQCLRQALQQDTYLQSLNIELGDDACRLLADIADGDARRALNLLEIAADLVEINKQGIATIDIELIRQLGAVRQRRFDKGGDDFYDIVSALHKSIRGSNPHAAQYWLCRMLDGGVDPAYIARRLLRIASEDIGNADPRALQIALDAWQVIERLGSPEGELALSQAALYLACAPKSNAVYLSHNQAMQFVKQQASHAVPPHLRNAPTQLAKSLGHGRDYRYAHDYPDAYVAGEDYFPAEIARDKEFYHPVPRGLEIKIGEKLQYFKQRDKQEDSS